MSKLEEADKQVVLGILREHGRQMLSEGRKHPRTKERFLVQACSVFDPSLAGLASVENQSPDGLRLVTELPWELGAHMDLESVAGNLQNLKARTRVVYCQVVGPKRFVVGLNILSHYGDNETNPSYGWIPARRNRRPCAPAR